MAPKTTTIMMFSSQKVKSLLRMASMALLFLYIYNIHRISQKRGAQQEVAPDNNYFSLPMLEMMTATDSATAADLSSSIQPSGYHATGCLSTVLYYYMSASLLWNIMLFSTRKHRKSFLIGSIICLLAIINFHQFNQNGGHCSSMVDLEHTNDDGHQHIIATRSDASSWEGNNIRISFSLHDPDEVDVPSPDTFSKRNYRCRDRPNLPPSLAKRTILNFTTSIRTDLNVAFMGDSIGAQFAQAFDAAALGKGNDERRWAQGYRYNPEKDWVSECLTISSPTQGGGISSFWRMTGLMSVTNRRELYICDRDHHNNKGWAESQALTLLDHPTNNRTNAVGAYDAFVMRVPHGWLSIDQISKEGIIEQINLNNKYLGAETVIISTLPLCNNVVTPTDWKRIGEINDIIRDIARNWPSPPAGENGIRTVLVQEFANYTSQIIWSNAKDIGLYNGSMPDYSLKGWEQTGDFLFDRLTINGKWPPSKAQVCVSRKFWINDRGEQCHLNRISVDGSHWCINSLGARHSASIACLLGCAFNGEKDKDINNVRECEQKCNDQFMTVLPVEEEWIGTGTSIFAT